MFFLAFHAFCAAKNVLKSSLALSSRGVIHDLGEVGHETEDVVENLTRRCGDISTEPLCCLTDKEVFKTLLKAGLPVSLSKKKPELTGSCTSPPPPLPQLITPREDRSTAGRFLGPEQLLKPMSRTQISQARHLERQQS